MPFTSRAARPASTMARRTASTAIARVVRPEPREYSVSPTPTMQYLSRSVFIGPPCRAGPRPAGARLPVGILAEDPGAHAPLDRALGPHAPAGRGGRASESSAIATRFSPGPRPHVRIAL